MPSARRSLVALLCLAVATAVVALAATAGAAPGSLDTSFGTGGMVLTNLGGRDVALAVATVPGGNLLVAGYSNSTTSAYVARYDAHGVLDPMFGSGGIVSGIFSGHPFAIALQPDGRIVVAGQATGPTNADVALARLRPRGALDTTFGTNGVVLTNFGGDDAANAVAIQSDGNIVIAGGSRKGASDFILARYSGQDGSLDTTFGTGGKVVTDFGGSDAAQGVAIQPDGRIVAAGWTASPTNALDSDIAVARYNPSGSLDTSFGTGGKVTTGLNLTDVGRSIGLQSNGRIVVAGYTRDPTLGNEFVVVGYSGSDGSLDPTFGTGGKVLTGFGTGTEAAGQAMAVQPDDAIVVAGYVSQSSGAYDFGLARYTPDGVLDPEFGAGGLVITDFHGVNDLPHALAIRPDGRITVVGESDANGTGAGSDFAIARYLGDLPFQPDELIKKLIDASYIGDGVINDTGAMQTRSGQVAAANTKFFDVAVENDGRSTDSIVIRGCAGTSGFVVRYFDGSTEVTSAVTGGTYVLSGMAPSTTHVILVRVFVKATTPSGSTLSCPVRATSQGDSTMSDTVVAKVEVA